MWLEEVRNHSVRDPSAIVGPIAAVFGGTLFLVTEDAMPVKMIGKPTHQ